MQKSKGELSGRILFTLSILKDTQLAHLLLDEMIRSSFTRPNHLIQQSRLHLGDQLRILPTRFVHGVS